MRHPTESPPSATTQHSGLPLEIAAVGLLFAVVAGAVLVTYSRLAPHELYNVSRSGLGGGASRVVVLLNFPIALAAIAVLVLLAERRRGWLAVVAVAGIALSAAVFWPGMVEQADLDAKPPSTIAALGVAVAAALGIYVWRTGGLERLGRLPGDPLRVLIAAAAFLLAVPWLLADLGISLEGVPLLGSLYQTGELRAEPGKALAGPAVHPGHHHGLDGALLVWTALLLSRIVPAVATAWVRGVAGAYLALMLCYGAANLANDVWLEQVVKRGWTDHEIPSVTVPKPTVAWVLIVLAAAALWAAWSWSRASKPPASA